MGPRNKAIAMLLECKPCLHSSIVYTCLLVPFMLCKCISMLNNWITYQKVWYQQIEEGWQSPEGSQQGAKNMTYHKRATPVCLKHVTSSEGQRHVCCTHCSTSPSIIGNEIAEMWKYIQCNIILHIVVIVLHMKPTSLGLSLPFPKYYPIFYSEFLSCFS